MFGLFIIQTLKDLQSAIHSICYEFTNILSGEKMSCWIRDWSNSGYYKHDMATFLTVLVSPVP